MRGFSAWYQAEEKRDSVDLLGRLAVEIGDTPSYIDPVESLLRGEGYAPDYRMPGVGAPYFLFRQLWAPAGARDAYIVLQVLLSSIAVVLLALLALRVSGRKRIFYAVFLLFLISTYTSLYDATLGSDSLAVSTLIIHLYLLDAGLVSRRKAELLGAGVFLTWAIFAKPVLAPLLLVTLIFVALHVRRTRSAVVMLWFVLPFGIIDGAWVVRNHHVNGGFHPLTNQGLFSSAFMASVPYHAMRFVQGYGGDYIWWNPGSDIRWYGVWDKCGDMDQNGRSATPPPEHAYVPTYTRDSLERLSEDVVRLMSGTLPTADSLVLKIAIGDRFDRYALAYRAGRPFQYHVVSRLRMVWNIFDQNGTELLFARPFAELPLWAKGFKLGQSALYMMCFLLGTVGAFMFAWCSRTAPASLLFLLAMVAVYTIFIYPLGLRLCEWRYLTTAYPFALVMAVLLADRLIVRSMALR